MPPPTPATEHPVAGVFACVPVPPACDVCHILRPAQWRSEGPARALTIMVSHPPGIARAAASTLKWSVICALEDAGIAADRARGWTLIFATTLRVCGLLV